MFRFKALLVLTFSCSAVLNTFGSSAQFTPTTTKTAQTTNNTSTADSFAGNSNGNLAAGNVSKLPIRSLLYAGANTPVIAAAMGWWGKDSHISIGYRSDDPAQIHRQVQDMKSRGFDGLTLAWYGSSSTEMSNVAAKLIMAEAEQTSGFTFALRPNEGIIKWFSNGMTPTDALISHLRYAAQTFFGSSAYMRVDGRPVLLFFGFESYSIDWDRVKANVPGNPLYIFRNANGFTHSASDGAFAWGPANDFNYLDWYYQHALPYQGAKHNFGNAYKGFNDTLASWTQNRIISQQCGQTWLNSLARAGNFYSSATQLQFIQISTWNDYEEGTALETGVDNCLSVTAAVNGTNLSWTLTGAGQENTIDHYTVYASQDGENLMRLTDLPAGTRQVELGGYSLPPAGYTLYVQAVGKPSVRNQFSNGASYGIANQPPVATISLSATTVLAGGSVTVTAGGSDPDGDIVSTTIDFGDGATAAASSAAHTYTAPGVYNATVRVTDDQGATGSAGALVTVLAPLQVAISSPSSGSSAGSPVAIAATATGGNGAAGMQVLVDGALKLSATGGTISGAVALAPGTHQLLVKAWDANGAQASASRSFAVANKAPVARLGLSSTLGVGPLTVAASSSGSSDPDGSIVATRFDFGDGAIVSGSVASHIYSTPGTYTVRLTVTDNLGASATATSTVQVNAGVTLKSPTTMVATSFRVTATASSSKPISSMIAYVDGVRLYTIYSNSLDTTLKAKPGSHLLEVKAWNSTGTMYKASRTISVQ